MRELSVESSRVCVLPLMLPVLITPMPLSQSERVNVNNFELNINQSRVSKIKTKLVTCDEYAREQTK